ncbi:peptidase S15 [Streptomyces sp. CB02923]|uniref:CocE/NonD family hydrolase n=1 Tax=Streptomyces sp. CB02923 TaxID=1718985 RepID=UPI0009395658|nr:CocE/NonD family hydrolase [Streptomyces sp. CB02923]OKH98109.1 peptidase S15 [Streptomyces sp. CB02923]
MTTATHHPTAKKPPLSARAVRRTLRGMPAKLHDAAREPGLVVPAADGSPLLTDHYFPLADGDFPTLLVRSPYGRGVPWAPMFGMLFAEQGFHVVLQSSRGTGGSGGEYALWQHEAADGQAAVEWLRRQPWFTGVLGTIGPSALGYAQWALAADPPPELRAMVVQVGVHDMHGFFYPSGPFALENALVSALGRLHYDGGPLAFARAALRLQRHLRKITRTLPLGETYVPGFGGRVPFLEEAMAHPDPDDPHWQGADAGATATRSAVPTCLITGWHDVCLGQTLRQYGRLRRAGRDTTLLIGPWTHNSAMQQGWPEVFAESLAWLRAHLYDDPSGLRGTRARVHVGGRQEWRDLPDWPPAATEHRWYLDGGGALSPQAPVAAPPLTFRYDPADPTPSVGGPLLGATAGPRDNAALEARDDVLTFTTPPLTEPVDVLGTVAVDLRISTDTGYADVFARLCDVDERGRSVNVCDGIRRLDPAAAGPSAADPSAPGPGPAQAPGPVHVSGAVPASGPEPVTVEMSPAAHSFAAGHRIRLQISGGAHPRFARNTGTGEPLATATRLVPVEISLHHPSALVLPQTKKAFMPSTSDR